MLVDFFCCAVLSSTGWVRSTILSFWHCSLALSSSMLLSINTATSENYYFSFPGAVIRTRAGGMRSVCFADPFMSVDVISFGLFSWHPGDLSRLSDRNRILRRRKFEFFDARSGKPTEAGRPGLPDSALQQPVPNAGQEVHEQVLGSMQEG